MQSVFPTVTKPYNLRNNPTFKSVNIHTTYYGTETLTYRGPKTWDLVPKDIKESNSLIEFKKKNKVMGNQEAVHAGCVKYI